jgi:hypothetical protein
LRGRRTDAPSDGVSGGHTGCIRHALVAVGIEPTIGDTADSRGGAGGGTVLDAGVDD